MEDIIQTSINTGPRGAIRLAQGVQAFLGVGGEWLADVSKVAWISNLLVFFSNLFIFCTWNQRMWEVVDATLFFGAPCPLITFQFCCNSTIRVRDLFLQLYFLIGFLEASGLLLVDWWVEDHFWHSPKNKLQLTPKSSWRYVFWCTIRRALGFFFFVLSWTMRFYSGMETSLSSCEVL